MKNKLATGLCQYIDRMENYYESCEIDFVDNARLVEFFKGCCEALRQVRFEVIRQAKLLEDEND